MANHRIPIPTWLNEAYMEDILVKYFKQPDLKVKKIDVTPGSAEGDNYICLILRIKLDVDIKGNLQKMSFIGKLKPVTKANEVLDGDLDVFALEALVYEKILPGIKEVIKGTKDDSNLAPECINVDFEKQLIVMEDLGAKNYILPTKVDYLNKDQALLAAKAFAKLHGGSYKLIEKDPSLKGKFEYGLLGDKPDWYMDKWIANCIVDLKKNIGSYGMSEDWQRRLLAVGDKLTNKALKICNLREDRLNVLCHGDAWKSNMLYHFTDGVADSVKFIDFQISTYNTFAIDLQFCLFGSVEADVLVNDLDLILKTYYNTLKEVAPDIPNLSLDLIKKEFAELSFVGCMSTVMFRSFVRSEIPIDYDKVLLGETVPVGFDDPMFIGDLFKLLPLMEKAGVF